MVTVKLKVRYTENQDLESGLYSLAAYVTEYVNITKDIFVFQITLQEVEEFQTVATPVSVEKYPATTPTTLGTFFRKREVVLEFETLEKRDEARDIMESLIRELVIAWQRVYPTVVSEGEVEYTAP